MEETTDLLKDGHSIEEIAELRGYTTNTIVNHICKAIENEMEIGYNQLVSADAEAEVRSAVEKVGNEFLKPIKEAVDESISYDAIKFVLAKMKSEENN